MFRGGFYDVTGGLAILKRKDDHERIFLVKDFGGSAPRKINKEEQVGGRDISESQNFLHAK